MPEINLRVKVIGGKRTDLKIYVENLSINKKEMTLKNGAVVTSNDLETVIHKAIIDYISRA